MISSQSRIVVSRWAMIRQVQPRGAGCRRRSFRSSGQARLWLRRESRGWDRATRARAICSRWRWPPEKFRPCSLTIASVAATALQAGRGGSPRRPPPGPAGRREPSRPRASSSRGLSLRRGRCRQSTSPTGVDKDLVRQIARGAGHRGGSRPLQGWYSPAASRPIVDFPLPELPTRAMRWPGRATNEKSLIKGSSTVRL